MPAAFYRVTPASGRAGIGNIGYKYPALEGSRVRAGACCRGGTTLTVRA